MKFFSWLGTLLIILLIIAAITAPGDQKFTDFISKNKGGDTMSCKPVIGKSTEIKLLIRIASKNMSVTANGEHHCKWDPPSTFIKRMCPLK